MYGFSNIADFETVTGEINLSVSDSIQITAVGRIHEKIKAAEAWGFKKWLFRKKIMTIQLTYETTRLLLCPPLHWTIT